MEGTGLLVDLLWFPNSLLHVAENSPAQCQVQEVPIGVAGCRESGSEWETVTQRLLLKASKDSVSFAVTLSLCFV